MDDSALSEPQLRLATAWRHVVGTVPLGPQSSFYDAGGDSLSAVQIGLVMEREGWPRAAVRATFEGRGLAEVAELASDTAATPVSQTQDSLPDKTVRNWSISMTRGVMVLCVLLSHWGAGVFARFGLLRESEQWLSLIYRAGTPGFAAVFGIGIGYFMLPDFAQNRRSVLKRLATSLRLVLLGLVVMAGVYLLRAVFEDAPLTGLVLAHSLYGVLGYYALILALAPLWLPALARLQRPVMWLILSVPVFFLAWQGAVWLLPSAQVQNLLEWPRLHLWAGNYNVLKMTMSATAGAALGYWMAQQQDTRALSDRLLVLGGSLAALCVFSVIQMDGVSALADRNSRVFTTLPGLMLYLALAAALTGLFLRLVQGWQQRGRLAQLPMKVLIVTGGLALPIYVFHGVVIPARDVLVLSGTLAPGPALATTMGLFCAGMLYAGHRLWRMYFG